MGLNGASRGARNGCEGSLSWWSQAIQQGTWCPRDTQCRRHVGGTARQEVHREGSKGEGGREVMMQRGFLLARKPI
jgi:hypothetical protein